MWLHNPCPRRLIKWNIKTSREPNLDVLAGCVCARQAAPVRVFSGLWKRSRNQLQLFSVDNVIKLRAAANPLGSASYLERTEIYKRRDRSAHSKWAALTGTGPIRETGQNLSCGQISAGWNRTSCRKLHKPVQEQISLEMRLTEKCLVYYSVGLHGCSHPLGIYINIYLKETVVVH